MIPFAKNIGVALGFDCFLTELNKIKNYRQKLFDGFNYI